MTVILIGIGALLVGSVPFGVMVGRLQDVDPRTAGSGNIGATNVARLMGWRYGLIVLIFDMGKGAAAAWLGAYLGDSETVFGPNLGLYAGFCATLGHCYSIFLKGKGGKGVATAIGATLVLIPVAAGLGVFVWIALSVFFRIAAVSSILAMTVIAIVIKLNGAGFEAEVYSLMIFCLITIRHISNLKQLKARWFSDPN